MSVSLSPTCADDPFYNTAIVLSGEEEQESYTVGRCVCSRIKQSVQVTIRIIKSMHVESINAFIHKKAMFVHAKFTSAMLKCCIKCCLNGVVMRFLGCSGWLLRCRVMHALANCSKDCLGK